MKKIPLGPKRFKPSNHRHGMLNYGQKEKEEDKAYESSDLK